MAEIRAGKKVTGSFGIFSTSAFCSSVRGNEFGNTFVGFFVQILIQKDVLGNNYINWLIFFQLILHFIKTWEKVCIVTSFMSFRKGFFVGILLVYFLALRILPFHNISQPYSLKN